MAILGSKCVIAESTYNKSTSISFSENRLNNSINEKDKLTELERVPNDISYDEFFKRFLVKNIPCLVEAKHYETSPKSWKISKEWVTEEGTPNWSFINEKFGNSVVPVADCSHKEYNSQAKEHVWLPQYIKYCERLVADNHDFSKMPCLYLKDWHFCRVFPGYEAYDTPVYFQSDWLNGFCRSRTDEEDDYCFVYIGPKGTWTPFHADVFGSFSWSTNICGLKRWLLFPPGAELSLKDSKGKLAYNIDLSEMDDPQEYPEAKTYFEKFGRGIEVIQRPGETIFVPSGWHHQVWNTEDTISVNHNWFNGCNIDLIWHNLVKAYREVKDELEDCQEDEEWHSTCQLVLKAHHGMNYSEFVSMLEFAVFESSQMIEEVEGIPWHVAFDLERILAAINLMKREESVPQTMADNLNRLEDIVRNIQIINNVHTTIHNN